MRPSILWNALRGRKALSLKEAATCWIVRELSGVIQAHISTPNALGGWATMTCERSIAVLSRLALASHRCNSVCRSHLSQRGQRQSNGRIVYWWATPSKSESPKQYVNGGQFGYESKRLSDPQTETSPLAEFERGSVSKLTFWRAVAWEPYSDAWDQELFITVCGLSRRKRRGTPDVHLLKDSWTAFTLLCRRKGSVKVTTYPTIVEMQSAVSTADQDRIFGAPAGGRRAIASKAVSTGFKSISCILPLWFFLSILDRGQRNAVWRRVRFRF